MKTKTLLVLSVLAAACFLLWTATPLLAGEGTITGTVTEDAQIITIDGEIYAVSENETSEDLMEHIGKTIEATGTLTEEDGENTIIVNQFKVLEE